MPQPVLYKYRSFDNWKFLLDIFVNGRLFASPYKQLNDPMEGRFQYRKDRVSRAFRRSVRRAKRELRICSLSRTANNTLMWSYYSRGHSGVVLGVKVRGARAKGYTVEDVTYDQDVWLGADEARAMARQVAITILSRKQLAWEHEEEVRVFSDAPFVEVTIQEIILGCQAGDSDRELIESLASRLCPRATVSQLHKSKLDQYPAGFAMRQGAT